MGNKLQQELKAKFDAAQRELSYFLKQYEDYKDADELIAAAQQWGIMCGLATAAELTGSGELKAALDGITPRLYPSEF